MTKSIRIIKKEVKDIRVENVENDEFEESEIEILKRSINHALEGKGKGIKELDV